MARRGNRGRRSDPQARCSPATLRRAGRSAYSLRGGTRFTTLSAADAPSMPFDGPGLSRLAGFYAPTSRFRQPPTNSGPSWNRCMRWALACLPRLGSRPFPKDRPWPWPFPFDGCISMSNADPRIVSTRNGALILITAAMRPQLPCGQFDLTGLRNFISMASRVDAGGPRLLYRDYLGPDGEWLANERAAAERSRSRDLSAAGQHRACFSTSRALVDRRKIHHLADGDQPTTWAAGISTEVEHGLDARHARYFEFLRSVMRQFQPNNISFSIWYHYHRELHAGPQPR